MKRLKSLWKLKSYCRVPSGAVRLNCLAVLIGLSALAILLLSFHATPAGAGLDASKFIIPTLTTAQVPAAIGGSATGKELSGLSLEELNQRIHHSIHTSRVALQLHVALLEVGKQRVEQFPDYTATFLKQERLDGEEIQDLQTCQLKLRHKPFSVYMKWIEGGDEGRELLYVEDLYDGKMLVKLGGNGPKKLLPHLKLEPNGSLALKEARHPVTEMGLLQLADLILGYRKRDLTLNGGVRWRMLDDQKFADRDCYGFVVEYDSSEVEPTYRKSITFIDKELSLPVCVKNYGWPDEETPKDDLAVVDEATLIEFYGYKDIAFQERLGDADFDKTNTDYRFKR